MLNIIVAITRNMAIGRGGDQLAYIREDLLHFKAITKGHPVIMGRKTNLALPKKRLPERRNIVITRNQHWTPECPEVEVAHSLEEALSMVDPTNEEVYVIGGGEIYRQAMPLADRLYVTHIEMDAPDADTFFPPIGNEWKTTELSETMHDDKSGLNFCFATYERTSPFE